MQSKPSPARSIVLALIALPLSLSACAESPTANDSALCGVLRQLPHVGRVVQCITGDFETKIIHVKDRHFVPFEHFVASLTDGEPLDQAQLRELYAEHLNEVEAVQKEQAILLLAILQSLDVSAVFMEGLTRDDMALYGLLNDTVASQEAEAAHADKAALRVAQLRLGAVGRLCRAGKLKEILPLDDAAAMKEADPVNPNGTVKIDLKANEKREDAMVTNLLSKKGIVVAILGGGHDLSDNLHRLSDGKAEYVQVQVAALARSETE